MALSTKTELRNRFTEVDKPGSPELNYLFSSPRNNFFESGWSDWASRFCNVGCFLESRWDSCLV